ncbi:hypothetical protein [Sphingomonas sp. ACRSK]|uniref:hypothetical protein n=1 Tax=Sphingomonas sp. ACRSK TaxID=2918213 RepID=UPI001EF4DE76|nr:hypothetical protein [Sphingomonas sp. ACRSK]MCG7349497.1 hypothetical protein [Sphingomonas sp. ACRSK]
MLLTVVAYATVAETALATVRGARSGALLADLKGEPAAQLDRLSDRTMRTAIAAAPLEQRVLNVAMARDAKRHGRERAPIWLVVLSRLGWRDTGTLQNRIYAAALRNDLSSILDISDALLRRQQLADQITQVVLLLEVEPTLRPSLVKRLAGRPSWRSLYLGTTIGHLKTQEQLSARVLLMEGLARYGPLDKSEVVPSINALDHAGLVQQAFTLWQRVQPGVTRPLDDGEFDRVSRSYGTGYDPVPFQWQMMTGEGFGADAIRDGAHAVLTIHWSGRGVPVFAQQRTSAAPGHYALDLDIPVESKADLSTLSFKLACSKTATPFVAAGSDPTRLRTVTAVPCAFPMLQIVGDVQPSAAAHQVTISRIAMRPLNAGSEAN